MYDDIALCDRPTHCGTVGIDGLTECERKRQKQTEEKMMKRFVSLLLTILLVLGLSACVSQPTEHTMTFVESKDLVINEQTYIGLFYDYTNNSGETAIPADAINVKAFQNGTELVVTVFTGQKTEDAIQCDTSVQNGTTVRVVWLFERVDESPVSVEMSDGQKFTVE